MSSNEASPQKPRVISCPQCHGRGPLNCSLCRGVGDVQLTDGQLHAWSVKAEAECPVTHCGACAIDARPPVRGTYRRPVDDQHTIDALNEAGRGHLAKYW